MDVILINILKVGSLSRSVLDCLAVLRLPNLLVFCSFHSDLCLASDTFGETLVLNISSIKDFFILLYYICR